MLFEQTDIDGWMLCCEKWLTLVAIDKEGKRLLQGVKQPNFEVLPCGEK